MTVHEWVRGASARLALAGVEASRLEAQLLAAHAQGADRTAILAHPRALASDIADEMLERRLAGEPLAYILGYREFYGRRFEVSRAVLIPRHETETLVELALRLAPEGASVLEVGVGSGCVAITLKLERPGLTVAGIDVSEPALRVAAENAQRLGADVSLARSDGFAELTGAFDLIVSNPPYVAADAPLAREIRDHEPALALFAGPEGLDFYRRLAKEAPAHLNPAGRLAVEIGDGMAQSVRTVFEGSGWIVETIQPDLGGMPRAMALRR